MECVCASNASTPLGGMVRCDRHHSGCMSSWASVPSALRRFSYPMLRSMCKSTPPWFNQMLLEKSHTFAHGALPNHRRWAEEEDRVSWRKRTWRLGRIPKKTSYGPRQGTRRGPPADRDRQSPATAIAAQPTMSSTAVLVQSAQGTSAVHR